MDAALLTAFAAGAILGCVGSAVGIWATQRRRRGPFDLAKMTFHRPREGVLVVEIREDLSATYAAQIRSWLEAVEAEGTAVLVVALGDRP